MSARERERERDRGERELRRGGIRWGLPGLPSPVQREESGVSVVCVYEWSAAEQSSPIISSTSNAAKIAQKVLRGQHCRRRAPFCRHDDGRGVRWLGGPARHGGGGGADLMVGGMRDRERKREREGERERVVGVIVCACVCVCVCVWSSELAASD